MWKSMKCSLEEAVEHCTRTLGCVSCPRGSPLLQVLRGASAASAHMTPWMSVTFLFLLFRIRLPCQISFETSEQGLGLNCFVNSTIYGIELGKRKIKHL